MPRFSLILKASLMMWLTVGGLPPALADDDDHGSWWGSKSGQGAGKPTSAPAQFQKECASCHMAYPTGRWQPRQLRGLPPGHRAGQLQRAQCAHSRLSHDD